MKLSLHYMHTVAVGLCVAIGRRATLTYGTRRDGGTVVDHAAL